MRSLTGTMTALALLASIGFSAPAAANASASTTDPATGITTTSVRNSDGSRDVTRTDTDGNVVSRQNVYRDRHTGNTETTVENEDGSRTHTHVDPDGKVLFVETEAAPAVAAAGDWNDDFEEWSEEDADDTADADVPVGETQVTTRADGSRSTRRTTADGDVVTVETDPNDDVPGGRRVTTDHRGRWTPDGWVPGTRRVTMYDFDGRVVSDVTLGPAEAREARLKEREQPKRDGDETTTAGTGDFDPYGQFRVPADVMEYIDSVLAEDEPAEAEEERAEAADPDAQSSRNMESAGSTVAADTVLAAIRELEAQSKMAGVGSLAPSQGQAAIQLESARQRSLGQRHVATAIPNVTALAHSRQIILEAGPSHPR